MNIIQILPQLKEGGVETGVIDLCIYLKEQGHRVTVISNGGPLTKELTKRQISHLLWPVHQKNPFTIYRMSRKLIHFIKHHKIDIVHARSRVPGWIAYLACRKTKTKWITTCHGYYRKHFGSAVMGWADKVIAATLAIQNHMVEDFKVPLEKMVLIPRGVDLQKFTFSPPLLQNPALIGFIGRITPLKGHKDFLRALYILKKDHFSFKAHIIGQASQSQYLQELKKLTAQLELTQEVHFLGHQDQIENHLKQINLLVIATTHPEAFGRVIIEAQACGVPVVATRVGGIQEIIDHEETGILCHPHHPKDIAHNIKKIFLDESKTKMMIQKARLKVENFFSKNQMVKKTLNLYEKNLIPKILVIKLSSLGDAVLMSPSLRTLRQHFLDSHITLLTDEHIYPIFEHCPYINEIILTSKKERKCHFFKILSQLKRKKFDISIDFQNNYWTHGIPFLAGIPKRYGYERRGGNLLLNYSIVSHPLPPVEHQFQILKHLKINPSDTSLEFWFTKEDQREAFHLLRYAGLNIEKPFSVVNIGASWKTKQWKPHYIAQYCDALQKKYHLQILLIGSKEDLGFEKEIKKCIEIPLFSLVGKTTLRQTAPLIQRCYSFLSSDSVPLHIASCFQKPTLALFGPTDPNRHKPPSQNLLVLNEKVDCGPCYKPSCSHHSCMVKLLPDRVIETHQKLTI